jgi:CBS domain-containing protein
VPAAATTALDAFALMDAEGASALGVCDDAYRIVASISISDLRGLKPEAVDRLSLPIVEFLKVQRAERRAHTGRKPKP